MIHCNDAGKIIHEGILSRLGEEEFMLFGRGGFWANYKLRHGKYNASSKTDDWFNFQVSKPNSLQVIEKAAGSDVRDIGFMRFRKSTLRVAKSWLSVKEWLVKSDTNCKDRVSFLKKYMQQ